MNQSSRRSRLRRSAAGIGASGIAAFLALVPAGPAQAFEQGTSSLSLGVGSGQQFKKDYTILSARAGYYFVREFEGSVGVQFWRGPSPSIMRISPELRYVYTRMFRVKPYAAVFLSRSIYGSGVPDRNTYGVKGGAYWSLNPKAHLAVGGVYERIENCDPNMFGSCSDAYPEVSMHFTF